MSPTDEQIETMTHDAWHSENAHQLARHLLKLLPEVDTLRKRNEKLERVAEAARKVVKSAEDGDIDFIDILGDALSDLDKEDA